MTIPIYLGDISDIFNELIDLFIFNYGDKILLFVVGEWGIGGGGGGGRCMGNPLDIYFLPL